MLFRKKTPKSCSYCVRGTKVGTDQILCIKYGIVSCNYACRKFTYDPCKRIPRKAKAVDIQKFNNEDFQL